MVNKKKKSPKEMNLLQSKFFLFEEVDRPNKPPCNYIPFHKNCYDGDEDTNRNKKHRSGKDNRYANDKHKSRRGRRRDDSTDESVDLDSCHSTSYYESDDSTSHFKNKNHGNKKRGKSNSQWTDSDERKKMIRRTYNSQHGILTPKKRKSRRE